MAEQEKKRGKLRRSLAWTFKPFVNVKGWLGYDDVKNGYRTVSGAFSDLFRIAETDRKETFEEAVIRLHLDEATLKKQSYNFFRMFLVCILIFIAILTLSLFWLFTGGFFGGLVALLFSFVALANAIRYHFWVYQIKSKKLGCTLQQWFYASFMNRRTLS